MVKRRSVLAKRKQSEQKQKRLQIGLGVLIVVILIMSTFGIILSNQGDSEGDLEDGGYTFTVREQNGMTVLWTEIGGVETDFLYLPSQVQNVSLAANVVAVQGQDVYLAFDPRQDGLDLVDFIRFRLSQDLQAHNQMAVPAVVAPMDNFTLVDCQNASSPVILVRYGNMTRVAEEDACIIIEGASPQELVQATERFRYDYHSSFAG
ncbi:MAG: hypothetical protein ACOCWQ_00235 [Nanoarchaeota archaeon]